MSEQEQEELEGEEAIEAAEHEAESEEQSLLANLQAERDDLESKLLRVSADYQNFARRAQQNVDSAVEQKLMDIARGLVTVMDHFDRALDVQIEGEATGVLQGVTMVHDELMATLKRFGIEINQTDRYRRGRIHSRGIDHGFHFTDVCSPRCRIQWLPSHGRTSD